MTGAPDPKPRADLAEHVMLRANRDLLAGSAMLTALVLFVGCGWPTLRALDGHLGIASHAQGLTGGDRLLVAVMLLNLALILFGWRRYRDLLATNRLNDTDGPGPRSRGRTDELSGFLHRQGFLEAGSAMIAQAVRRDRSTALLLIDLDPVGTVEERHGHRVEDSVLDVAAGAIRRLLPPTAIAGRIERDVFAVLMGIDPRHASVVDSVARHIVDAFAYPFACQDGTVPIGASIGLARSQADGQTVDALLRRGTLAMQAAKAAGQCRYAWFDAAMEVELTSRTAIEAGLVEGIRSGQFVPYYEPQVDLETGALRGFEVLARWNHPTRGLIGPDYFVAIAEDCGLIGDLSVAVMRRAFAEARDWDPSLSLSVNISPAQLCDPWLAQKVVKLLVETGFCANRLEIEITEDGLFQNLGLAKSIISSLKNQGIRLALDDFGTGYSSLAHLRALPFDTIKIDRSCVMAITTDPGSAAVVNAISTLCERLNLPVTAEGVENEAIRKHLTALGCHKGQGWHLGKPMTIGAVRRLLAEKGLLPAARRTGSGSVANDIRRYA